MADRFSVDPGSLRRAGSRMAQEGRALEAALTRLQGRLSSLGDVAGDDEQGRTFAAGYEPKVALLESVLKEMVAGLENVDRGLSLMAANYDGSEAASQTSGGPR